MYKKMRKSVRIAIVLLLALAMSAAMLPLMAVAESDYFIDSDTASVNNNGSLSKKISENHQLALEPGQVMTGKTVDILDATTGEFTITLEAIGRRFETEVKRDDPVCYDVVFVLDYSGSMDSNSKLSNMKSAASDAMTKILLNNTSEKYNRVAAVYYNSSAGTQVNWRGRNGSGNGVVQTVSVADLNRDTGNRTNTMAGVNAAYNLLNARVGDDRDRPAIIVLMSDGQPNGWYTSYAHGTGNSSTGNPDNANTTNGSTWTAGSIADANAIGVYYTIMNIWDVKYGDSSVLKGDTTIEDTKGGYVPKLDIYSIGFDLGSLTATTGNGGIGSTDLQQRHYAYVSLNPSESNLAPDDMASLRTQLQNSFNPLSSFTNPVVRYESATSDLGDITSAFTTIIESITYNDPINENITIVDKIDSNYIIDLDSFVLNGELWTPDTDRLNITNTVNGVLTWNFKNLEVLASDDENNGVIYGHPLSTLSFNVKLKESAIISDNIDETFYTNTSEWNNSNSPNYAEFDPLHNNPYYGSNARVHQSINSTGMIELGWFPGVYLTKVIDKAVDVRYPSTYTFEFILYTMIDGERTNVATLSFNQDDFSDGNSVTKRFSWNGSGEDFFMSLVGKDFFIEESAPSGWKSSISNGVPFVRIGEDLGKIYLLEETGKTVTNFYDRDPRPFDITLNKSFFGDLDAFEAITAIPHVHTDDCEEACDIRYDDVDSETEFTFVFDLYRGSVNDDNLATRTSLTLTRGAIIAALEDNSISYPVVFEDIYANNTPGRRTTFIVVEENTGYSWITMNANAYYRIDRFGYSSKERDGTNNVGDVLFPELYIEKNVIDTRYDGEDTKYITVYDWSFDFELTDEERGWTYPNPITLDQDNPTVQIKLKDYVNGTAVLTLREVVPEGDDGILGMTYDGTVYTIHISDGQISWIEPSDSDNQRYDDTFTNNAVFNNEYYEPITPEFSVEKITTGYTGSPLMFNFNIDCGSEFAFSDDMKSIISNGYQDYKLPVNFSGKVTISEIDEGLNYWTYDHHSYELVYSDGKFVSAERYLDGELVNEYNEESKEIIFENSYYEPPTTTTTTNPQYGSLEIVKLINGATAPDGYTATFTVSGPGGYSNTFTLNGAGTRTLTGLNPGSYTVTETSASEIAGYTWTVSGSGQSVSVAVNQTSSVTITNTYTAPPPPITETTPPVEIAPPEVPLGDAPPVEQVEEIVEIENIDTPLGELPQTDGLSYSLSQFLALFGIWVFVLGVGSWVITEERNRRALKKNKD